MTFDITFTEQKLSCSLTGSYCIKPVSKFLYQDQVFFLLLFFLNCVLTYCFDTTQKNYFHIYVFFTLDNSLLFFLILHLLFNKKKKCPGYNLHRSYIIRKKVQKNINWNHRHYICALY